MDIPEIPDEQLATEYDNLAYKALANPDLSEGLANQIARVSRNTTQSLRGGKREGSGRKEIPAHLKKQQRAVYVTDAEFEKVETFIEQLRQKQN